MRKKFLLSLLTALPLFGVACGGGGNSSPTAPSTPSFQGQWTGIWVRQGCSESGPAAIGACSALPGSGPLSLVLSQAGTSTQGSLSLGTLQTPVSGPIESDGTLRLTGQSSQAQVGTITLTSWRSNTGTTMTGSFSFTIQPPSSLGVGQVSVSGVLQGVVKS